MLKIKFERFENVVVAEVKNLPELTGEAKQWFDDGVAVRIGEAVVERITYGITYMSQPLNHFMNGGGIYLCPSSQTKHMCFDCRTEEHAIKYVEEMEKAIDMFNAREDKGNGEIFLARGKAK